MPRYIYDIAQVNIRLDTPFPIEINNESAPFLSESHEDSSFCVAFSSVDALPPIPKEGVWHEDRFYTTLEAYPAVFFRDVPSRPPYAVMQDCEDGMQVLYLPEVERYFHNSAALLNHLGIENILLRHGAFLLHASFIRCQGKGILFSAPCGTGKSTQAELWERYMGSEILNGDRAGVRCMDGIWTAFGMPFAGTSGIYRNESAPIMAVVTLVQGPENVIRRLRPTEAIRRLLPECSCRRWDQNFMEKILNLLLTLTQQIPVYLLECRPDEGAVQLLRDTISKDVTLWL